MAKRKPSIVRSKPKASTKDIVGPAPRNRRINPRWQKHYDSLSALRDNLLRQQVDLAKDALDEKPTFSSHMADAASDSYDRDLALSLLSSEQDALYEIDEALDRIRNGKYGICELTGKPIEARRLQAIPWTRFSAAAENELEKQGGFKRPHLGRREPVVRETPQPEPEVGGKEILPPRTP